MSTILNDPNTSETITAANGQMAKPFTLKNHAGTELVSLDKDGNLATAGALSGPTIDSLNANIALKAPVASPTFTGTVTAPAISSPTIDTINANNLIAARGLSRPIRGRLAMTFDDGLDNNYTVAYPILNQYGFRATAYVITNLVNFTGRLTLAQMHDLEAHGWEIGSHTVHHLGALTGGAGGVPLTTAELESEYKDSRDYLVGQGFNCQNMAFPGGEYTAEAGRVASKYYQHARLLASNFSMPFHDLRTPNEGTFLPRVPDSTLGTIKNWLMGMRGGTLAVTFHNVGGDVTDDLHISTADFTDLVSWCAAQGIVICPLSEVMLPSNRLPDGDFVNGLTHWSVTNGAVTVDTSQAYVGSQCLRLDQPTTGDPYPSFYPAGSYFLFDDGVPLTISLRYKIPTTLAGNGTTQGLLVKFMAYADDDWTTVAQSVLSPAVSQATDGWQLLTFTVTPTAGLRVGSINIKFFGTAGTAYVDHVVVANTAWGQIG